MKKDQVKRRPMSDRTVASLEAEAKSYRINDGEGVYLNVQPTGRKTWLKRYTKPDGKRAWKSLGTAPELSGRDAHLLSAQLDQEDSEEAEESPHITFREAGEAWMAHKKASGLSPVTLGQYERYIGGEAFDVIGAKELSNITRRDCAAVQTSLESRGAYDIARKMRSWLSQVFSFSVAHGWCEMNPASELRHIAAPRPGHTSYPFLRESELGEFMHALAASRSGTKALSALKLVMYLAVRPGMVRAAEWSEIEGDCWHVPAEKMKTRLPFTVPLSRQAMGILAEMEGVTGQSRYIFPGNGGVHATLSENSINGVIKRVGFGGRIVGHGFRHTASTLLNEHGFNHRVIEAQLSHKVPGIEGVYNRAIYLDERREMMQWYADHLDSLAAH